MKLDLFKIEGIGGVNRVTFGLYSENEGSIHADEMRLTISLPQGEQDMGKLFGAAIEKALPLMTKALLDANAFLTPPEPTGEGQPTMS